MSGKPTLQDIAAMPFPASVTAMRKHYQHDWGKPLPEGATEMARYEVTMRLTVTTQEVEILEVEAWSKDEAEAAAEKKAWEIYSYADDIEIESANAKRMEVQQ